jgi:predicted dehydrogenase/threonine dehydrogenase-like Zn-dependent dehydrogenase
MRQILQSLKTGETILADVPAPRPPRGHLLVRTQSSVISVGTERMLVGFGQASYLEKARQQPEKVKQVLDKVRSDGLLPTVEAVQAKLSDRIPLGYCNAGVVEAVGEGVTDFAVGDRVVSNGPHAELVVVPHRLAAKMPDGLSFDDAAWTVLAAIGLQGIRLAQPTLGESVVVIGLGAIGLLTVQMLQASGARVLGIDLSEERCRRAESFGAQVVHLVEGRDPVAEAQAWTDGRGVDAVLITAATKSNEPMAQAAGMCRKRGRIVLVGVTGLQLARSDFYEKELTFQVSCSYGPGRYDPEYENRGHDYPLGFVRWTEQRNFEAVLHLLATGGLRPDSLVTHRCALLEAPALYQRVADGEPVLGAIIGYPSVADLPTEQLLNRTVEHAPAGTARSAVVGVIGAGNFTVRTIAPALKKAGARLRVVASSRGVSASKLARDGGFERSTTDIDGLLADDSIDSIVVTTRHDSHADLCARALRAGKAVFVEKPLATTHEGLDLIEAALDEADAPLLMVGFNRRYGPLLVRMKALLDPMPGPVALNLTINAGIIPPDHWVHDPVAGGGRIVGEGCHFFDLARFLVGHPVTGWQCTAMRAGGGMAVGEDKALVNLSFADGSIATIQYLGNGHKGFPKERVEAFKDGKVLQLDNFQALRGWGVPTPRRPRSMRLDKGHEAGVQAFVDAVRAGGPWPIPRDELFEIARLSIDIAEAARQGGGVG